MTELSWIGSLAGCLGNAAGPLYAWTSSKMDDRYIIAIGGLITVLSKMLASITNEVPFLMKDWYPCLLRMPLPYYRFGSCG